MCSLRRALVYCSIFACHASWSQGFNKRYDAFGQGYAQGAFGIERSGQDYLVFAGSYEPDTVTVDSLVGIYTIIFEKINAQGELLSEKKHKVPLHGIYVGVANCCDSVAGGGYVSGGGIEDLAIDQHVRLMRYDANGDTLWTRDFSDGTHFWISKQVKTLSDGGFLICGFTDATGVVDGFAIRTDAGGNELWRDTYGWSSPTDIDAFVSVQEGLSGELYMSGTRYLSDSDSQHWIQRTDPAGVGVWRTSWGGAYKEGDTGLALLADGYPLVAGGSGIGPDYSSMRPYLAKIDTADGSRIWEHEYGATAYINLFFVGKQCPNTNIIAAGVSYASGYEQGLLLRASSEGDSLWMRRYWYNDDTLDQGQGRFYDVLPTDDGGFIAAGFANGAVNGPLPEGYSQDAWVVKVDSLGCIVPGCDGTGVESIVTNLQGALTLAPNPAHGQVQVHVALPPSLRNKPDLKLTLVNAAGQVALVQAAREGDNTLPLGALSSGVYYVHLSSNTTWFSGTKLVVE